MIWLKRKFGVKARRGVIMPTGDFLVEDYGEFSNDANIDIMTKDQGCTLPPNSS